MNKFENGLLNPEPEPATCYLQEEDPPEDHDLLHYSAVCGRCYAALAGLLRSAEDQLAEAVEIITDLNDLQAHPSTASDRARAFLKRLEGE
jgi:hypothetical protein